MQENAPENSTPRLSQLRFTEWILFVVFGVVLISFQCVLFQSAGGFWRDESNSIQVARQLTLAEQWKWMEIDSFPALFSSLLRSWIGLGLGSTEANIRLFGTLIGISFIPALALAGWWMTGRAPLIALALAAMNPNVFYYGSSIRAYGLSASMIVVCIAAFWRLTQRATLGRSIVALVFAMLSVHSTYQNAFLIFAVGIAGAYTCIRCRLWKRAVLILSIGFLSGVSMLVYVPIIGSYKSATLIAKTSVTAFSVFQHFAESTRGSNPLLTFAWFLVSSAVVAIVIPYWSNRKVDELNNVPSLSTFCFTGIVTCLATGCFFYVISGRLLFPWHFISMIAFLAIMVDAGTEVPFQPAAAVTARIVTSLVLLMLSFGDISVFAHQRRTNVDLICQEITKESNPGDLVLVSPFYLSPVVSHYCDKKVSWNTLPEINIADDRSKWGPYSDIKKQMETPDSIAPTLKSIADVLSRGNQLWVLGAIHFSQEDEPEVEIPPAPHPEFGWSDISYATLWSTKTGDFIRKHATMIKTVAIPEKSKISPLEEFQLIRIEGWHE